MSSENDAIEADKSKPFSHMVTGVILRAFAAHPAYRHTKEAQEAARLLIANMFKKDNYPDRAAPEFWFGFTFPFWFTDLLSALDAVSQLGFSKSEPQINKSLDWFWDKQQPNGLWQLKILKGRDKETTQLWLTLAISKVFKRLDPLTYNHFFSNVPNQQDHEESVRFASKTERRETWFACCSYPFCS